MAKLNGTSSLPPEAQNFLDRYNALLKEKSEAEAIEAIIRAIYRTYYEEMGGGGEPPDVKPQPAGPGKTTGNVTAFKRPPPQPTRAGPRSQASPRLPVAMIFVSLVILYTAFRYLLR